MIAQPHRSPAGVAQGDEMANSMEAVCTVPGETGGRAEIRQVPVPQAGPGEVLIRVRAAGVNRGEIVAMKALRTGSGSIGGVECSGEVAAVGEGVTAFRTGDAVMAHARGSQARYVAIDARAVMPKPAHLDWQEAAAFPNVFTTAHDALITNGRLQRGEIALVNAASSGIGMAAIQIARWAGAAQVVATSRSADKLRQLMPLGITDAVVADAEGWSEQVLAATGKRGVDVIADSIGASVFEPSLRCMALQGRLVNIGRLGGKNSSIDLDYVALRRLHIIGVTFRTRTQQETLACVQACARDLLGPLQQGELKPIVDRAFALTEVAQAHAYMLSDAQVGKIVLTVD
jgi:NADPH2:quinone reductase